MFMTEMKNEKSQVPNTGIAYGDGLFKGLSRSDSDTLLLAFYSFSLSEL